jgi:D-alanyl-D-alanine dipeptidase
VAPPDIAPQPTGAAVVVTLCTTAGDELDLGTPVHAIAPPDSVDVADLGPDALANRRVLVIALSMAGLVNYPPLWWHWSYGDRYWATRTGATACYDVVDPPRPAIEPNMD